MSIYGTIFTVGDGDSDSSPGRVSSYTDNDPHKIPRRAGKGHVGLAHIPGWCWPTAEEDPDTIPDAPWLRLSVGGVDYTDVCLDLQAARSLRDALTQWLDGEHLDDLETP